MLDNIKVDGNITYNVSLSKYSWFQVGGNAQILQEEIRNNHDNAV